MVRVDLRRYFREPAVRPAARRLIGPTMLATASLVTGASGATDGRRNPDMIMASPRPPQVQPEPGRAMIRVMIVDDHELIRAGVRSVMNRAPGLVVVGECADGTQVLRAAAEVHPDVVVMDLQMPVMGGVDATRRLLASQPGIKVLVLTGWANNRALLDAELAGASGYLLKDGDGTALVTAVRTVAAGGTVWPSRLPLRRAGRSDPGHRPLEGAPHDAIAAGPRVTAG